MELRKYWRVIGRRWWLVVVPVVVVAAIILATYVRPGPVYQVVMRFAAGTQPAGLSEDYDRYYPWLTSEYIANGLADIAETGAFAEAVSGRLLQVGIEVPAPAVEPAIITDNAQSILVIYLVWPNQAQAIAMAEAVTAELTENASSYFPQIEGIEPALRRLDAPVPVALAPGLRTQLLGPAMKLALALVGGVALALLFHYLDPTVREASELEQAGLAVLAEIPRRHRIADWIRARR
jgi:capsular polysaccharide biosynthesis protein